MRERDATHISYLTLFSGATAAAEPLDFPDLILQPVSLLLRKNQVTEGPTGDVTLDRVSESVIEGLSELEMHLKIEIEMFR